jgi:exopolysaccharide biosynthesis polyprenyl glycosylphosphotransferase
MKPWRLRLTYVLTDYVTTSVAWVLFNVFRISIMVMPPYSLVNFYQWPPVICGQILLPLLMLGVYWLSGYYNVVDSRSRTVELSATLCSTFIGAVLAYFIVVVNDMYQDRHLALEQVGVLFACLMCCVYAGRVIVTARCVNSASNRRRLRRALIVGNDAEAHHLGDRISAMRPRAGGYKLVSYVDPVSESVDEAIRSHNASVLILSQEVAAGPHMADVLTQAMAHEAVTVLMSPTINQLVYASRSIGDVQGEPLINLTDANVSASTANIKRTFDVVLSAVALVVLSPLMLSLAIAVKCSSPGPVIYRQERVGRRRRKFNILKFRSMHVDAEKQGRPQLADVDDPRATSLGRVMRKYRLDELPQFWNVIRGDMSLVGPRPERQYFADQIMNVTPLYSLIYQVRPGITSWGSVKFGYASSIREMVLRLRFDLIYMENISLLTDLKIILYTVSTVLSGKGK